MIDTTTPKLYIYLWNKYRPAILQLMTASSTEPQQYKLYGHEFRALNRKDKASFVFTLVAYQGKAVNKIKESVIAQDLLNVLQESKKASELMSKDTYEFNLDRQFVLHVKKQPKEVLAEATT